MSEHGLAYDGHELEAAANLVNCYRWITARFQPFLGGHGVEIGAGIGTYARYIRPHFQAIDLVERSPNQRNALATKFGDDAGVQVFSETIDRYHARVGDNARDAICMVNVLEHIEDDEEALRVLAHVLKDGGHLCVFVPAMPFLFSKFDEDLGHIRRYTKRDAVRKFEAAGFEVVRSGYMDLFGVPAWGLVHTLLGTTRLDPLLTKLYDSVFIPVTRAIESVVPIPVGKNLLIVGRKNG